MFSNKKLLLLSLVLLIVGLGVGYFLPASLIKKTPSQVATDEIVLPPDATKIADCENNQGALYIKPQDLPVSPVYMLYNSKVIGIEYMLNKDEFNSGKSFVALAGLGVLLNHVNIGFMPMGHAGNPVPHYHIDMYSTDKLTEQQIKCASSMNTEMSSPSATMSPMATSSATPTGVMQ